MFFKHVNETSEKQKNQALETIREQLYIDEIQLCMFIDHLNILRDYMISNKQLVLELNDIYSLELKRGFVSLTLNTKG